MIFGSSVVVVEWSFEAAHTGPFAGRAASGSSVQVPGCSVYEFDAATRKITGGRIYFDLGTLYFGATYEMKHLPMPQSLQSHIEYKFFPTGHMVYVNEDALHGLHDRTAEFIRAHESGE